MESTEAVTRVGHAERGFLLHQRVSAICDCHKESWWMSLSWEGATVHDQNINVKKVVSRPYCVACALDGVISTSYIEVDTRLESRPSKIPSRWVVVEKMGSGLGHPC